MQKLLKKLNESNIKIDLIDEKLDIQAPKGVMTEDLLNEIKLFKNDLIEFIMTHKSKKSTFLSIPTVPQQSTYILSSSQRRIWLLSQFQDGKVAYNIPSVFILKGDISVGSLEKSFFKLIERHESLRTVFKNENEGEIRQTILGLEEIKFQLDYEDFSNSNDSEEKGKEVIRKEILYCFDLSNESLIRAKLIKISQDNYLLLCLTHHIISDGNSGDVIARELFSFYNGELNNLPISLPELKIQYKDFAAWQQDQLKSIEMQQHKEYWCKKFAGELPILNLPTYQMRPPIKNFNGKVIRTSFNKRVLKDLKDLCDSNNSTLFIGLLATIKLLLFKYTNQKDIIIGTPVVGREHLDLQNQIGFYSNTLALRTSVDQTETFLELLSKVRNTVLEGYDHQIFPYDKLIEELSLKCDSSRNPLFEIMVTVLKDDFNQKYDTSNIKISDYHVDEQVYSKFDIDFAFIEGKDDLKLILTYNPDIFSDEFINGILDHYEILLQSIIHGKNIPVVDLQYISEEEKYSLLFELNNKNQQDTPNTTIIDLFEEQVLKTPENIAVVYDEIQLTYRELNEYANQLGNYLTEKHSICSEDLVGIFLEKSEIVVIAILGILKAGAAYVPIDSEYPDERVQYIKSDSDLKAVIDIIEFELFNESKLKFSKENIKNNNKSSDLAYVIYTSGTTGAPKGVMIEHGNVVNLINAQSTSFKVDQTDNILQFSNFSFDASVEQIFLALLNGASLFIASKEIVYDFRKLESFINDKGITHLHTVPNVLNKLEAKTYSSLKRVISGGDICPEYLAEKWSSYAEFYNEYGPTETTVTSIVCRYDKNKVFSIGTPIDNTQVYILDEFGDLLPQGFVGRLFIAGAGVSRGYINKTELTKEKFIVDPFVENTRMYDSGDYAKWLPDGSIEFHGRKDNQVKIRGFRIELGEIEFSLLKYSNDIKEVVVVTQYVNEEKTLAVYYVSATKIDHSELRAFLALKLPESFIPSFYIALEFMPLTFNGKIDHTALPDITGSDLTRKQYIAPRNETEKELVKIWEEVLEIENIGITDDFFELGGHSLKLMMLGNKIELLFNKKIDFYNLYKNTSFLDHIELINKKNVDVSENCTIDFQKEDQDIFVLPFPGQERLHALSSGNSYYYIKRALRCHQKLNLKLVETVFNTLIERHETLRSNFVKIDNQILLKIAKERKIKLEYFDLRNLDIVEKESTQFNILNGNEEVFNLEIDLLIRLKVIHLSDDEFIIFTIIDHILIDGWGLDIFFQDLYLIYNSLDNDGVLIKPIPQVEYTFRQVLDNKRNTNKLTFEEDKFFWIDKFSDGGSKNLLPYDFDKENISYFSDSISIKLDEEKTLKMINFSKENKIGMLMLYLSCVNLCLAKISNQSDVTTGIIWAEREDKISNDSVGFLLSTLPVRTKMDLQNNFSDNFKIAKSEYLNVVKHRNYPFTELVKYYDKEFSLKDLPYYNVFVYASEEINVLKKIEDSSFIPVDFDNKIKYSIYELIFVIDQPENSDINLSIVYNKSLFKKETIEYLMANLLEVIDSIEI